MHACMHKLVHHAYIHVAICMDAWLSQELTRSLSLNTHACTIFFHTPKRFTPQIHILSFRPAVLLKFVRKSTILVIAIYSYAFIFSRISHNFHLLYYYIIIIILYFKYIPRHVIAITYYFYHITIYMSKKQ